MELPKTLSLAAALAVGLLVLGPPVAAQSDLDELAAELIEMRGRVEELNSELDRYKSQHKERMASLASQRGELEATKKRKQLEIEELRRSLDKQRERARKAGVGGEALRPVVERIVAELKQRIRAGLPFKRSERESELEEIEQQMVTDVITPQKAVNRLWTFYEDEIRLTSDNGIYRQTIRRDGDNVLADVAKLGMVLLFYRTDDRRYGMAQRDGGEWSFTEVSDGEDKDRIDELFEALRKQIRTGYFVLPNPFKGTPFKGTEGLQ